MSGRAASGREWPSDRCPHRLVQVCERFLWASAVPWRLGAADALNSSDEGCEGFLWGSGGVFVVLLVSLAVEGLLLVLGFGVERVVQGLGGVRRRLTLAAAASAGAAGLV